MKAEPVLAVYAGYSLHGIHVNLFVEQKSLRPQGPGHAAARAERDDEANLMLNDFGARIPLTLERRLGDDARLAPIDEKRDARHIIRRLDARAKRRHPVHEAAGLW